VSRSKVYAVRSTFWLNINTPEQFNGPLRVLWGPGRSPAGFHKTLKTGRTENMKIRNCSIYRIALSYRQHCIYEVANPTTGQEAYKVQDIRSLDYGIYFADVVSAKRFIDIMMDQDQEPRDCENCSKADGLGVCQIGGC
jgi:hypothetical protein